MKFHYNAHGIAVLRLHYEADPTKGGGEKVHVPAIGMDLSPWAKREFDRMTDKSLYRQEYEIDGSATLGQLMFHLDEEASIIEPGDEFPIPQNWTRRMSLDPHPAVPHAFLWCATDPYGDRWYYRELWPSSVAFRYEGGELLGSPGPCPDNDADWRIRDYVAAIRYLESSENPENTDKIAGRFDEKIYQRVIDYAARAFGKGTNDDDPTDNFQTRYEQHMSGTCKCEPRCQPVKRPFFDDAKKDVEVGREVVNAGLKRVSVMGNDGEFHPSAKIHIFRSRCPELIWQLKNARRQQLTPLQAQRQDPSGRIVKVRTHQADNLRYLETANPVYVAPSRPVEDVAPPVQGLSY